MPPAHSLAVLEGRPYDTTPQSTLGGYYRVLQSGLWPGVWGLLNQCGEGLLLVSEMLCVRVFDGF